MRISQRLGLRAQEISLLQIKEVATLIHSPDLNIQTFKQHQVMSLPAAYTKGANATGKSKAKYQRKNVTFSVERFAQILKQVAKLAGAGISIEPEDYYPDLIKREGVSRDLPLVDQHLCEALEAHLQERVANDPNLKANDPLFLSQRNRAYSPNSLQEHMALMLRNWTGIEKASSHSGRRALITNIIHDQKKSIRVAQKIAGHKRPSTTVIYTEPPETEISDALEHAGDKEKLTK